MPKHLSAKYYQDKKERLQKEFVKDIKEKKKKSDNMFVKNTKISQKMKRKIWLSIEVFPLRLISSHRRAFNFFEF